MDMLATPPVQFALPLGMDMLAFCYLLAVDLDLLIYLNNKCLNWPYPDGLLSCTIYYWYSTLNVGSRTSQTLKPNCQTSDREPTTQKNSAILRPKLRTHLSAATRHVAHPATSVVRMLILYNKRMTYAWFICPTKLFFF